MSSAKKSLTAAPRSGFQKALARLKARFSTTGILTLTGDSAKIAEMLKFTEKDVGKFERAFFQIDIDESGEIDYDEFMEFLGEERSPYSDAVIALVDESGTGCLKFNEFFRVVCIYSMYTQTQILEFCFQTFDKDGSGTIDEAEFLDMVRVINNADPTFPGNFKTALEEFDGNADGLISFREFKQIHHTFPLVMFPAFQLQDKMHLHVCGSAFWVRVMKEREKERLRNEYIDTHGCEPPLSTMDRLKQLICCGGKKKVVSGGPKRRKKKKDKKQKRKKKKKRGTRSLRNKNIKTDKQKITRTRISKKEMLMELKPTGPKVRHSKFQSEAKVHPYNGDW